MALTYHIYDDEMIQYQISIWKKTSKFRWFLLDELCSDNLSNKEYDRVVKIILDKSWH